MIKPPHLIDTTQLVRNRTRAAANFADFNFLKQAANERLVDRLLDIRRNFDKALDYGAMDGSLTTSVMATGKLGQMTLAEISPDALAHTKQAFDRQTEYAAEQLSYLELAPESWPVEPQSLDAVFSTAMLHWVNDLPGLMRQMASSLRPDGLFLIVMLGGRSLMELRQSLAAAEEEITGGISPRCLPFADIRDLGGLLQRAGLALPVADADLLTVTYSNMFRLMADLRGMGENNALYGRLNRFTSRQVMLRAAEIYAERFGQADGRIPASFELVTLTGWAPSDNQQKPLRPGSATSRLADVLQSDEQDPLG
ncbi:MAG: methyltransferase domain-containing protein [Candidatus Puniceispirillaceae bacterium]